MPHAAINGQQISFEDSGGFGLTHPEPVNAAILSFLAGLS
jgi:hypothetical protein